METNRNFIPGKANMNTKLLKTAIKYFKNLEENEKIIKYLYENTELFEQKYMDDFQEELFRFFTGKIGTFARQRNTFLNLLNDKQLKKFKELEIIGD